MTTYEPIPQRTTPQTYKFSQRDYRLLCEHGAFDGLAKAELIEGVIVAVNAQYARHVRVQTKLFRALADTCDGLGGDLEAWIEGSVSIDDSSMPQPDILLSRGLPEDGPIPVDRIALIVEIADSSLKIDLETKARVYAIAGIPEYWVADVQARTIHRMSSPEGEAYAIRTDVPFGIPIHAATIDGLIVETSGL